MASTRYKSSIKYIAAEGGGVKGLFLLGAFKALAEMGLLKDIEGISGTSIGAFFGTGLALGFSPEEMQQKTLEDVRNGRFSWFLDFIPDNAKTHYAVREDDSFSFKMLKRIYNIIKSSVDVISGAGLCYGDYIEKRVLQAIQEKFPDKEYLTFQELHELKKSNPQLKDIYITAYNLSDLRLEIFSYENTPDMPIHIAVHCSMAVPGIFKPVLYNGKLYVDGGVACNLPIKVFDELKYTESKQLNNNLNMNTLGICLSSPRRTRKMRDGVIIPQPSNDFFEPVVRLFLLAVTLQDLQHRYSDNPSRMLFLNTGDIRVFDFNISAEKVVEVMKRGEDETTDYLKKKLLYKRASELNDVIKFYKLCNISLFGNIKQESKEEPNAGVRPEKMT